MKMVAWGRWQIHVDRETNAAVALSTHWQLGCFVEEREDRKL